MTDPVSEQTAEEDRIRAALPGLRNRRIMAGIAMAAVIAVAAVGAVLGLSVGDEGWKLSMFSVILGGFGVFWIASATRKAHEAQLMPIVAGTIGVSHDKSGKDVLRRAPKPLIPMGGSLSGDDVLSGKIGDRWYQWAEVHSETGGKNSRTLFDGLLVSVSVPDLPHLLCAPVDETRRGILLPAYIPVEGMRHLAETWDGAGEAVALWTEDTRWRPSAVEADEVLKRLMAMGAPVGGQFFSATATGDALWIAVSTKRDYFQIGGVGADATSLMSDIRRAAGELQAPTDLAAKAMELADWLKGLAAKPQA